MSKQAIIHVGAHKTGSTSIQAFVSQNSLRLRELGIELYTGDYIENNHVELMLATMRENRQSPFKMDNEIVITNDYYRALRDRIFSHFDRSSADRVLFSAEGLSYLRYPDEMERLQSLMPTDQIRILFYVREPVGFLKSYRTEMSRHRLPATIEPDSFAYTAPDSWLIDFPNRVAGFSRAFGAENVTVIDYDDELKSSGNIVPSFVRALDIEGAFDASSWSDLFLNTSRSSHETRPADTALPP